MSLALALILSVPVESPLKNTDRIFVLLIMEYKTYLRVVSSPERYSRVCNKVSLDKNLSMKAKGAFLMMVSLSTIPDWDFSVEGFITLTKEGETAVRAAIKELKKTGYLEVVKKRPIKQNYKVCL